MEVRVPGTYRYVTTTSGREFRFAGENGDGRRRRKTYFTMENNVRVCVRFFFSFR